MLRVVSSRDGDFSFFFLFCIFLNLTCWLGITFLMKESNTSGTCLLQVGSSLFLAGLLSASLATPPPHSTGVCKPFTLSSPQASKFGFFLLPPERGSCQWTTSSSCHKQNLLTSFLPKAYPSTSAQISSLCHVPVTQVHQSPTAESMFLSTGPTSIPTGHVLQDEKSNWASSLPALLESLLSPL